MWNWNFKKQVLLSVVVASTSTLAGFSSKETVFITLGIWLLVEWLVGEINFIRNSHGTNLEELEEEIENLKEKLKNFKVDSPKKAAH